MLLFQTRLYSKSVFENPISANFTFFQTFIAVGYWSWAIDLDKLKNQNKTLLIPPPPHTHTHIMTQENYRCDRSNNTIAQKLRLPSLGWLGVQKTLC